MEPTLTRTTPTGAAAALAANVVWGLGNVIIVRVPLGGLGLAFHRLWMGGLIYLIVLYASGGRLTSASFRLGYKGALAFAADICTFFLAVKHTTLADATTISALQPVVIALFAGAVFGERIQRRHVWATAIALIGIIAVVQGSRSTGRVTAFGEIMAVLGLAAWAWYFIASKTARQTLDTLEYMTVVMIVGFVAVAPFALITGQAMGSGYGGLHLNSLVWVLMVVIFPGSGHLLINWAHSHTTIMLTSLSTLLMPVISTAAAAVFIDQPVNATQVVGIAIVLIALAVVIIGDTRSARSTAATVPT